MWHSWSTTDVQSNSLYNCKEKFPTASSLRITRNFSSKIGIKNRVNSNMGSLKPSVVLSFTFLTEFWTNINVQIILWFYWEPEYWSVTMLSCWKLIFSTSKNNLSSVRRIFKKIFHWQMRKPLNRNCSALPRFIQ